MASLRLSAASLASSRGISSAATLTGPRAAPAAPRPALPTLLTVEAKQGGGKLKTRKAAAKRYKVTASGKVFTRRPGKQHINEKMSSAKLASLSKEVQVPVCNLNNVIKCLPYAGVVKNP